MRNGPPPRGETARSSGEPVGLLAEVLEALFELLDAAGGVEDALLARVERVRRGGDLDVDHRVRRTVELDGLVAARGGTREEGLTRRQVPEDDRAVLGVDAGLHDGGTS